MSALINLWLFTTKKKERISRKFIFFLYCIPSFYYFLIIYSSFSYLFYHLFCTIHLLNHNITKNRITF